MFRCDVQAENCILKNEQSRYVFFSLFDLVQTSNVFACNKAKKKRKREKKIKGRKLDFTFEQKCGSFIAMELVF